MIVALVLAPRVRGNLDAVDPGEMLRRGQTIWDYDGWRLTMPEADAAGSGDASSAVTYAIRHPLDTARLMVARVGVHLIHVRPFYSASHNVVIALWLLPVYLLTAVAVWAKWGQPVTRWCAVAFGTQALVVALTHADWDGRYLAHVMPTVYPFVALGLWTLVDRRHTFTNAG